MGSSVVSVRWYTLRITQSALGGILKPNGFSGTSASYFAFLSRPEATCSSRYSGTS